MAEDDPWAEDVDFLVEVVVSKYERQKSQTEVVNAMPLYPTEAILWDDNQVPQVHYTGAAPSAPAYHTSLVCQCPSSACLSCTLVLKMLHEAMPAERAMLSQVTGVGVLCSLIIKGNLPAASLPFSASFGCSHQFLVKFSRRVGFDPID